MIHPSHAILEHCQFHFQSRKFHRHGGYQRTAHRGTYGGSTKRCVLPFHRLSHVVHALVCSSMKEPRSASQRESYSPQEQNGKQEHVWVQAILKATWQQIPRELVCQQGLHRYHSPRLHCYHSPHHKSKPSHIGRLARHLRAVMVTGSQFSFV